jgi:geranylgeranyl diphosphate synthase type I
MSTAGNIEAKLAKNGQLIDLYINDVLKINYPEPLYKAARHLLEAGGKRLRPSFVLESSVLVGGEPRRTIPLAAAVELLHNFTLIHDDIMDNDDLRRSVPTVHRLFGVPIAIASGDLLFAKVYEAVSDWVRQNNPTSGKMAFLLDCLNSAAISICEGQVLDISFESSMEIKESDYYRMIEGKTAALFKASTEIGGAAGGADARETAALGQYGLSAGMAFQLFDDYLGATADEKVLGKPVGSDLREGKMTLIVVHALDHASSQEREKLVRALGNQHVSRTEITEIGELYISLGSLSYTLKRADEYVQKAKKCLKEFPDCEAKQNLIELVDFFVTRKY